MQQRPFPSIRVNHRPGADRFFNEWVQTLARDIVDPSQPDAADPSPVLLGRDGNDRLVFGLSAADAFFLPTDVGFIHLHTAVEPIPLGPDHRTPQLVEPTPSCLVAAQAEHLLQSQSTPSGFLAGHVPHRLKPHSQGFLRPFKNRPRRQRGSAPTLSTLQVARIGQPSLAASTSRTSEALPPPNPLQKR